MVSGCMLTNILDGNPPFEGCGDFDVWSDTGMENFERCYHPIFSALPDIYDAHPDVTLLHVVRNTTSWWKSMKTYRKANIIRHWKNCKSPDGIFPIRHNKDNSDLEFIFKELYTNHTAYVREFAANHPSVTYLEFTLEDPNISTLLEKATGISSTCWGKSNNQEEIKRRQILKYEEKLRLSNATLATINDDVAFENF